MGSGSSTQKPGHGKPKQLKTKKTTSARGVTYFEGKIFVVCFPDTIEVFGLNYEKLEDINVQEMNQPIDIVACSETMSLYVADWGSLGGCVWRVSMDGQVCNQFIPAIPKFIPRSLSVTSGRLLVTTPNLLLLFGSDGVQLKFVSFEYMSNVTHAAETPRGTFVFTCLNPQSLVFEVGSNGQILHIYKNQQLLSTPCHLAVDSEGRMLIADSNKHHILLMTTDLQLDRVLLDRNHNRLISFPMRLSYVQQTRQLIVGGNDILSTAYDSRVVQVFDLD